MKKLLNKIVIASKAWQSVLFLVSFLILSSCCNFPEKENNMGLTLTTPGGTVQLSGNPILINTTSDRTGVSDQKMLLRITCTDGAIEGGPWIDSKPGTTAQFNISGIVDAPFNYEFDTDHYDYLIPYDMTAADITVEVGESYVDANGDLITVWNGSTTEMYIIKGKLDQLELAQLANLSSSFNDKYISTPCFLSNKFNETHQKYYVSDVSHIVKTWIYREVGLSFILKCAVFFSDGTNMLKFFNTEPTSESFLWEMNLDLLARAICVGYPTKTPVSYYVDFNTAVCEVFISNTYHEVHEEILAKNRLGGIEIIHCYGNITGNMNTEKESYTKENFNPNVMEGSVITQSTSNQYRYKVNTGYKNLHERKWIADLLTSDLAWWKSERLPFIEYKTFGIAPINFVPGSFTIDTTSNDLMPIEFEFEIAHID